MVHRETITGLLTKRSSWLVLLGVSGIAEKLELSESKTMSSWGSNIQHLQRRITSPHRTKTDLIWNIRLMMTIQTT